MIGVLPTRIMGCLIFLIEQEFPELVATDDKVMKSVAYDNLTLFISEENLSTLRTSHRKALYLNYERLKSRFNTEKPFTQKV